MKPMPPSVHLLGDHGEYEILVFRCADETEALRLAEEKLRAVYGEADPYVGVGADDELILTAHPGWYRINPCHCGRPQNRWRHPWDIGIADGPGRGNSRGYVVEHLGTRTAAERDVAVGCEPAFEAALPVAAGGAR